MTNLINKVQPPALPLAPDEYERSFTDQGNNVLRLFFNRLIGTIDTLLGTDGGGRFLYMPRGSFYSTVDQTAAMISTGYAVTFNSTHHTDSVTLSNNSRINVTYAGTYQFSITLQIEHNNSSEATVTVWEKRNGTTDTPYSGHLFDVKGNDYYVVNWVFTRHLEADDYIEIYWATTDTQLNLHAEAASALHPGVASATVDVTFGTNS
jgi:hypothetical protein